MMSLRDAQDTNDSSTERTSNATAASSTPSEECSFQDHTLVAVRMGDGNDHADPVEGSDEKDTREDRNCNDRYEDHEDEDDDPMFDVESLQRELQQAEETYHSPPANEPLRPSNLGPNLGPTRKQRTYDERKRSRKRKSPPSLRQPAAHLFCGVCCDLRRASLMVNGLYFGLTGLGLVLFLFFRQNSYFNSYNFSRLDDEELDTTSVWFVISMIKAMFGICGSLVGIVGAIGFHPWLVLATAIWMTVDALANLLSRSWIGFVAVGFFAYPNYALFWALQTSTITRENYECDERQCCSNSLNRCC